MTEQQPDPTPSQPPAGYSQQPPPGYAQQPPPGYGQPPPAYGMQGPYGEPGLAGGGQLSQSDERLWAMLAHLSGILASFVALGFLGPMVVMLAQGPKSPYVRRHAVEALNFQLMLLILSLIGLVAVIVTFGLGLIVVLPLALLVGVVALVLIVVAAVAANNGRDYRYPVNFRFVK